MPDQDRPFSLVVIGSSAGGIEALSEVVAALPSDFSAAVVIAQHLDPAQPSHLQEILARRTTLPVRTLSDHSPLIPGEICVVPSNQDVVITDRTITLRAPSGRSTPSVDRLFRSASDAFGERLIAVVLTGTGSDGALGARLVHEAGGTVVVQNPDTAAFPGMPRALSPVTIDVVAELADMGPLLQALVSGAYSPQQPADEQGLRALLDGLRQRRNVDFNSYRRPTILRRLHRRMIATGSDTIGDYDRYLREHSDEEDRLVGSLLIKVTDFFRDPATFDYLRERVLPGLIVHARERGEELRFWSAGCATGEEAFSLAVLVSQVLAAEPPDSTPIGVRIFATDLDGPAIAFARKGLYPPQALANLAPEIIEQYFIRIDGDYEVKKEIRDLIVFGEHDLGTRPPFPRTDLVLCRNVLMYFNSELQTRALQSFAFSLRQGGVLVLGIAESARPLEKAFTAESSRLRIYRRNAESVGPVGFLGNAASRPPAPAPLRLTDGDVPTVSTSLREAPPPPNELGDLIQQLPVGIVVVNGRYDIQHINGSARRLLGVHGLANGEDLIHLVASISTEELRTAIDTAFENQAPASIEEVATAELGMGQQRYLQIVCMPRGDTHAGRAPTVMVTVTDVTAMVQKRLEVETAARTEHAELDRLTDLMTKLGATNERLLAANADLAGAEEALRTTNEEYAAATAQAQTASEELEAAGEELQASNEELETLNEEMRATVEELNLSNADLEARTQELFDQRSRSEESRAQLAAILDSTSDAVIVISTTGAPLRTNPAYEALVTSLDGRFEPLNEREEPLPPEGTPHARAQRAESFNMDFTLAGADGTHRWFEAIGQPIDEAGLAGGLLILREVSEARLRAAQQHLVSIASHELRTPLTSLSGYLQRHMRLLRAEGNPRLEESAAAALEQSRRLMRLIDELLDLDRIERGALALNLSPVDLCSVAARAIEVAVGLDDSHEIRLDDPAGSAIVVGGDADRLENVVINLLTNALKHSPAGAPIDVRVSSSDKWGEIEVRDRGRGIAVDDLPRLFTRFFQAGSANDMKSGLGLGLYVSRGTVAAHGRELNVQSHDGEGATFVVRIPLLSETAEAGTAPTAS